MGSAALLAAAFSWAAFLIPRLGMYLALGLAIAGIGAGVLAYRRRTSPGPARLRGGGAIAIAGAAGLVAATKIVLTYVAIGALHDLL